MVQGNLRHHLRGGRRQPGENRPTFKGARFRDVRHGDFEDRARYNAALEAIDDPEKKAAFIDKWQAGCSSLNNIGGRAHRMAQALAATADTKEAAQ